MASERSRVSSLATSGCALSTCSSAGAWYLPRENRYPADRRRQPPYRSALHSLNELTLTPQPLTDDHRALGGLMYNVHSVSIIQPKGKDKYSKYTLQYTIYKDVETALMLMHALRNVPFKYRVWK